MIDDEALDMFGGPIVDVKLAQQIACVEREIEMRERVYPRWVAADKMTQAEATRELRSMRAVLTTLQACDDTLTELLARLICPTTR